MEAHVLNGSLKELSVDPGCDQPRSGSGSRSQSWKDWVATVLDEGRVDGQWDPVKRLGELAHEGISRARLEAIKAPAGLDIGAITTEEIALSIMTEMIVARRSDRGALTATQESAPSALAL